jgi:hypothetical protein
VTQLAQRVIFCSKAVSASSPLSSPRYADSPSYSPRWGEEEEAEKRKLVKPIKEAAYEVIACLKVSVRCPQLQPDFIAAVSDPYICPHIQYDIRDL